MLLGSRQRMWSECALLEPAPIAEHNSLRINLKNVVTEIRFAYGSLASRLVDW
jgi:hypothetical protein